MKKSILLITLLAAIPAFGQRKISHATIKSIEARMIDLENSLFLVDSLYKDYTNVGPFEIEEEIRSNSSDQGSFWLYNTYLKLNAKYPKKCSECKEKAEKMMQIINEETLAEMEIQYRKVIQKADDCFQQKDFLKAKEYYTRAVNLMPSDPYPKGKLKEVVAILAEQEKKVKE